MRMIIAIIATLVLVSCSKTELKDDPVTNAASAKAANLQKAKRLLLSPNSDQILTEISVINKATGRATTAYIVSSGTTTTVVAPPVGGISTGWILHNDGCFYHGTIYTGSDGQYIFVEDPNPYTDGYIGNEPRCGNGGIA